MVNIGKRNARVFRYGSSMIPWSLFACWERQRVEAWRLWCASRLS